MNVNKTQFEFFDAAVRLRLNQGAKTVSRKELVRQWLENDPQNTYGTGVPFGAAATHHMRKIAKILGANYVSEKGRNANARIEF